MNPAALPHRAVFISDVHLGARHCHAAELAAFLGRLRCETLYLVGDIVDFWWMAQRRAVWDADCQRVVDALHTLHRAGTQLVYVPGNHDRPLRRFIGLLLPGLTLRRRAVHRTREGRRLLVLHGDDYDSVTQFGGLHEKFGDWLYERILDGNRVLNRWRTRRGHRYWSLAEFLKRQSGTAERYIARFVQAALDDAGRRGFDGVVCGHIHRPALVEREGRIYANDGDWVESLSALVETHDGRLQLVNHHDDVLVELPPRRPSVLAAAVAEPLSWPDAA
jgi:UDP-2,3-diacylglucosamine pyrophosphatase LpxH